MIRYESLNDYQFNDSYFNIVGEKDKDYQGKPNGKKNHPEDGLLEKLLRGLVPGTGDLKPRLVPV